MRRGEGFKLCGMELDRFVRSVLDLLSRVRELEGQGVRLISVTQGIDTDSQNPMSRFQLNMLSAVAEFERDLIRERVAAGRARYEQDLKAGRVGKTVHSRSGKDLPAHRPRRVFDRQAVVELRRQGLSIREIGRKLGIGAGTVSRSLQGHQRPAFAE